MFKFLIFIAQWLLITCSFYGFAQETVVIHGRVLTEQSTPLAQVKVAIGSDSVLTDSSGAYQLRVAPQAIYQVNLSKANFYESVQTFSFHELSQQRNQSDVQHKALNANIDDITLVKKAKNRVMLAFGGDVMMGRRYHKPYFGDEVLIHENTMAADSKAIVEHVKPYMSLADFAAVNLETQIADKEPTERAPKSVTFYSPPEVLGALEWAGVDYVSLGNNHTYDYKESGLDSTLDHLSKSQLGYSGAGKDEQSALNAHHQKINNTDFSMLGYVGWEGSADPSQTATTDHGGAAHGSMENILSSVKKQVAKNHVPIVQYHGSLEYKDGPTGVTEQRLKASLDAGAALAIAHHPHVAQGLELYNNKLIAYSMGNFIFDQNFSATQHSFILYVWLDEGQFHRAEIVPLYLKGYKPTPATGMHRYTVMKRLTELSRLRQTKIAKSGGHGVITSELESTELSAQKSTGVSSVAINFPYQQTTASLYHLPWQAGFNEIELPSNDVAYRLGTNLINGSDFESFNTFTSAERGWLFDRENTSINSFGADSSASLALKVGNEPSLFGMQSFRRVYKASSPMTITAKFKTDKAVKVNFYWQGRKSRQKLFDAFNKGTKHLIHSTTITADNRWQTVEVDFNSPRIGYRSYRILAEFVSASGDVTQLNIDDFALIEWQSAYSRSTQPNYFNIQSKQASYIGINRPVSTAITLKF